MSLFDFGIPPLGFGVPPKDPPPPLDIPPFGFGLFGDPPNEKYPQPVSGVRPPGFGYPPPVSGIPPPGFGYLPPVSGVCPPGFYCPPPSYPPLDNPPLYSPPMPDSSPSPSPLSPPPPSSDFKLAPVSAVTPENWTNESSSGSAGGMSYGVMVGLILGAIVVAIGVGILVYHYTRNKRRGHNNKEHKGTTLPLVHPVSPSAHSFDPGCSQSTLTYEELSKATDNFSKANLLGQGGFGFVYKGVLSNGKVVAVKQLKAGSGQGEREFQAEIETISRIHHRHLVSLVGYCINEAQRLLVYEFVPNNTLEFHLHGKDRPTMNWTTRLKIAIGSAKGLAYLHEDCHPKIIHRDIKAANILLDNSFEAKVADFGLAKYFSDTETHVSTRVVGTFGYMAPEYASSGKLTEKSDVFSFGVVLLELITGRLPVARTQSLFDDSIVDWARPLLGQALQADNYDALVDPTLQKDYDSVEMRRVITCAAACVNPSAKLRPRMSQIARALEGEMTLDDLNKGTASGNGRNYGLYGSSDYNSGQYKEDLVKFRKLALESQELRQ